MLNVRLSYRIVFGMENQQGDAKIFIQLAQVIWEVLLNAVYIPNKDALNLRLQNHNTADQHLVIHML